MEHPALKEIVHVLREAGVKYSGEHAYRQCQVCKKIRRWKIGEILHKRVANLLLCNGCIARLDLATTNQSEIIAP